MILWLEEGKEVQTPTAEKRSKNWWPPVEASWSPCTALLPRVPIAAVAASSDGVTNVKYQRLFSGDEVRAIGQKRVELQKSYRPPGQ